MRSDRNIHRDSSDPTFRPYLRVERWAVRAAALCVTVVLATATGASAQVPSAEARQLARENPDLVRQRLLQSGLSERQIRDRLRASGLSPDALDQFFSADLLEAASPFDSDAMTALEALGIGVQTADGFEAVPVEAGLQLSGRSWSTACPSSASMSSPGRAPCSNLFSPARCLTPT